MNNHIYYTAAGSTSGPEQVAKWFAMLNHVRDTHTHEDPLYPECEHAIRKTTDSTKWLQEGIYSTIQDTVQKSKWIIKLYQYGVVIEWTQKYDNTMKVYWASWENTVNTTFKCMGVCTCIGEGSHVSWNGGENVMTASYRMWGLLWQVFTCYFCVLGHPFFVTDRAYALKTYHFFIHSLRDLLGIIVVKLCTVFFSNDFLLFSSTETPVFEKLEMVMTKKRTLNDVAKLSPHHQTSSLEAFHSVILRFAPKNVVFPYIGMLCRWEVWPCSSWKHLKCVIYLPGFPQHYKARNTYHLD